MKLGELFEKFKFLEEKLEKVENENIELKSNQSVITKKYENVAKRFHYVEGTELS